ncbi:MAG: hypothetical protein AAFR52_18450 [Pseudomonadota bacterium]
MITVVAGLALVMLAVTAMVMMRRPSEDRLPIRIPVEQHDPRRRR